MSTTTKQVDVLRAKCARKGLGVSGGAHVLLDRLLRDEKKSKKQPVDKKKHVDKKKSKCITKPKKLVAFKGGRLSASYYFHEVCKGKISRCKRMCINNKLKEIKIVASKNGSYPKWVLCK